MFDMIDDANLSRLGRPEALGPGSAPSGGALSGCDKLARAAPTWATFLVLLLSAGRASAQSAVPTRPEAPPLPDAPASAAAEAAQTRTVARAFAAQGAEAFERHQYEVALGFFQRAGALVQAPTIALMEARCLAQLGRLVEALDRYVSVQHMRLPDEANPAFEAAVGAAAAEGEPLRARIPLLDVRLRGTDPGDSVQVFLDGHVLPEALLGAEAPFDPGPHHVEVRVRDRAPILRDLVLQEGAHEAVDIEVPRPSSTVKPPAVASPPTIDPASREGGSAGRVLGWVTLSAGTLSAVAGVATGVIALGKESTLDGVCKPNSVCPFQYADELSSFRAYRTASYVTFGVAVVAVGGGALLLLESKPKRPVAMRVFPGGALLEGTF